MYQIAICDDEKSFCESLRDCISEICENENIKCNVSIYNSSDDFIGYLLEGNKIDLVFLCVGTQVCNGIHAGKVIREVLENFQIQIVYISYEKRYAMDLFATQPIDFLIKPIEKVQIDKLIHRFVIHQNSVRKMFSFKESYGDMQIPYSSIMYFKSKDHKIIIHTNDGKNEFYAKLSDIEKIVPDYFIRIHQSYLVNENFIECIHYNNIILRNEQKLPISKTYRGIIHEMVKNRA